MGPTNSESSEAARKRVAVEIIAKHERALRQTARRYSLCAADAEDAYQRGLEILLTKAPAGEARELIRWMQTVTKHEALAVRRNRERLLAGTPSSAGEEDSEDWVALIPAQGDGPAERAERQEAIARSREALQALKPAELKALTLLAEGYSYAEISELTGFTATKVNRCLAEGRERFRALLSRGQDGSRCKELRPLLSAFCDGEASVKEVATVREHLRVCAPCRGAMRAYRAAPGAAAALAPGLPVSQSILERIHDALGELHARLPTRGGGGADSVAHQVAASGGAGGGSVTALTKVAAICATAAGGTAAVATGLVPAPLDLAAHTAPPAIERQIDPAAATAAAKPVDYTPNPPPASARKPRAGNKSERDAESKAVPSSTEVEAETAEYTPAPAPAPEPVPAPEPAPTPEPAPASTVESSSTSSGAAGEFGP